MTADFDGQYSDSYVIQPLSGYMGGWVALRNT